MPGATALASKRKGGQNQRRLEQDDEREGQQDGAYAVKGKHEGGDGVAHGGGQSKQRAACAPMSLDSRVFHTSGPVWLRDFRFGLTGLTVRKTGARVPYSPSIIAEVTAWFRYFFAARSAAPIGAPFTIAFTPERARPWYLVWAVSRIAGARLTKDTANADVVMHFEDATITPNQPPLKLKRGARLINFGCADVSKSRTAAAFEAAFGYELAIDPTNHSGPAVEKSEINGAHDGRIVQCPAHTLPGRAYQRLVDNHGVDVAMVEDLRTCLVAGRPICVFIKRRPLEKRFQNTNSEVLLRTPDEMFSAGEMASIAAFASTLGLDWGAIDILRDRGDGRLYIVDANKTDMGPPVALSLADKMKATRLLAAAFRDYAVGAR